MRNYQPVHTSLPPLRGAAGGGGGGGSNATEWRGGESEFLEQLLPGGYPISESLAQEEYGFRCFYLADKFLDKANSTKLEAAFQRRFHRLPLGRRLWRAVGAGSNGLHEPRDMRVHKVFIAYSWKVSSEVAAGRLVINH